MTRADWFILGALVLLEAVAIYVAARLLALAWDLYRRPLRARNRRPR